MNVVMGSLQALAAHGTARTIDQAFIAEPSAAACVDSDAHVPAADEVPFPTWERLTSHNPDVRSDRVRRALR